MEREASTQYQPHATKSELEISEASIQAALSAVLYATLRPISLGLGAFYFLCTIGHLLVIPTAVVMPMFGVAAGTCILLLGFAYLLGRQPLPTSWAHPISGGIAGLGLLNSLFYLYLLPTPENSTNVTLVILGIGCFFLSYRWHTLLVMLALIGWGYLAWLAPSAPTWPHFIFFQISVAIFSFTLHFTRMRATRRLVLLHLQDEQQKRQLEETLQTVQQGKEHFRQLAAATSEGIIIHENGLILEANQAAATILGAKLSDIIGRTFWNFVAPESHAIIHDKIRQDYEEFYEIGGKRNDGTRVPLQTCGKGIQYQGRPARIATVRDITERKQIEALLTTEKRVFEMLSYRAKLKEVLEVIVLSVEAQSEAMICSILLLGTEGQKLCHGAALSLPKAYNRAIDGITIGPSVGSCGTAAYRGEKVIVTDIATDPLWNDFRDLALGSNLRACWSVPILAGDGRVLGTLAVYAREPRSPSLREEQVIERAAHLASLAIEHKRTEERWQESESRYRHVVENSPSLICTHDLEGVLLSVNKALAHTIGYQPEELVGRNLAELLVPNARRFFSRYLERVVHNKTERGVLFLITKAGEERAWMYHNSIYEEAGKQPYVISYSQDVTEQNQMKQELQRAREIAEQAHRIQNQFLANMSLEIRTPMNGILGMTELVMDTQLTPEQQDYITLVKTSADALLAIIDDILDFSKIKAEKLSLKAIPFNLDAVLNSLFPALSARASEKCLALTCHLAPDVPLSLIGDPERLSQILTHLVNNAIKFTPSGKVEVSIAAASQGTDQVTLHFKVQDTGIGIAAEKQKEIFKAFTQADGSLARSYGGTGLGLTICQQLVVLMRGHLWVESEEGNGSTFHFTAHLQRNGEAQQRKEAVILYADKTASLP